MSEHVNGVDVVANMADDLPMETADLHIFKAGTNIRSGWVITLAGPGHPQTVALADEQERERLHKAAQIERAQVNGRKWKGDEELPPEESRRKSIAGIVRRIVTWTPVNFGNGPIEFSQKNALDLFVDPTKGSYLMQVVEFLNADRAFIKGSGTN